MTLPRILVVSAAPYDSRGGTGTTLRAMFAAWPTGRLSQLHVDPLEGKDPTICSQQFPHSRVESILETMRRSSTTRGSVDPAVPASPSNRSQLRRRWAGAAHDVFRAPRSQVVDDFVRSQRPDAVYTILGSVLVTRLARRAAAVAEVPLVTHFMDDWLSTRYSGGELLGVADMVLQHEVRAAVLSPGGGLAISSAMAREYSERFGKVFGVAGNCVDLVDHVCEADISRQAGPLELVYFGGLHLGRATVLEYLADVLASMGNTARLRVFAPEADLAGTRLPGHPSVAECREAAPTELSGLVRQADVAVHVESFEPQVARFTRLSLSTKIPGYLGAGRPILAICPPGLASGEYVATSSAGIVVGLEKAQLREALTLLSDPDRRAAMARAGTELVLMSHTQAAVTEALVAAVRS